MNRRELLATATATATAAAVLLCGSPGPARAAALPEARRLLALLRSPAAARRIGRAYLETAADEADPAKLVTLIVGDGADGGTADGDLLRHVAERQRADFAAGRTVKLDGWVLSRTEARLYALAAV
ncbi:hypothetical protein JL100_006305 [Skermanella mucosa]|uniref:hypothetical protein n=1 Tax=Skermanella mucosa TaxID=1789672 RepID=UPI00192A9047|nr:hypothetical protein [Skermanella mucosa]UEM22355.1 hypothetical protein JL100_006305 [Skermanella mucosa]